MKKTAKIIYLLLGIVILNFSCKKSNENRTCWDCTVTRMDGSTFTDRTCGDDGSYPQYEDNLGNDLNAFCTRR